MTKAETNYELLREPLFICYATLLQEWYENPEAFTQLRTAVNAWLHDFCQRMEIDEGQYNDFLRSASATMTKMAWHAMLKDIGAMPGSPAYPAIKAGMSVRDDTFPQQKKPKAS